MSYHRMWLLARAVGRLVALAALLVTHTPPPVGAARVYLIRTIRVAEDPLPLLIDQPSDSILVPGGYPDRYGRFASISALSILSGRDGKVERRIAPPIGFYLTLPVVVPTVDGSGRVYIAVNGTSGLKQILPGGGIQPAGFALPGYYASGSIAVDRQRDRLVAAGPGDSWTGYRLSTSEILHSVPAVYTSAFVLDQRSGALYMSGAAGLTKREVRAGRVRATALIGSVARLTLVGSLYLVVTFGGDPQAPNMNKVSILDAQTLKVRATVSFGLLETFTDDLVPGSRQPLAVDTGTGRAVVLRYATEDQIGASPPGNVWLLDLHAGRVLQRLVVEGAPMAAAVDTLLHRVFIISDGDSTLSVVDTRTGALVATVRVGANPVGVVVDERDQTVFVANGYSAGRGPTGTVTMFDARITGNHG